MQYSTSRRNYEYFLKNFISEILPNFLYSSLVDFHENY